MICLSTGCTVVLEHYFSSDGLLQWNLSCIERPPVYKDHLKILWISSLYPQNAYMACAVLKKMWYPIPTNISAVKKGEVKKVQVTEWLKGVKSLWGQEEKIYQWGCQHTKQVK